MKAGWEWLESGSDGPVFVTTQPQIEEPEYGAFIRPKWLEHSDLDERTATPDPAVSGAPIIWYPHEDRLFLIGERNVMWVELGARWHGRPVSAP